MKKQRIKVSKKLKEQILIELLQEDCNIQSIATQYNLSIKTVSKWKSDCRRQKQEDLQHPNNQFIELTSLPIKSKISNLKKVELIFDDYSCSIAGTLSSNQLLKLVQLLEGGLC
jgi:transposase-like protein